MFSWESHIPKPPHWHWIDSGYVNFALGFKGVTWLFCLLCPRDEAGLIDWFSSSSSRLIRTFTIRIPKYLKSYRNYTPISHVLIACLIEHSLNSEEFHLASILPIKWEVPVFLVKEWTPNPCPTDSFVRLRRLHRFLFWNHFSLHKIGVGISQSNSRKGLLAWFAVLCPQGESGDPDIRVGIFFPNFCGASGDQVPGVKRLICWSGLRVSTNVTYRGMRKQKLSLFSSKTQRTKFGQKFIPL